MAIITLSRQIGSHGDEIAPDLANALGYKLIDKEAIHTHISAYQVNFSKELGIISEESEPGFLDQFIYNRAVYVSLLQSLIYNAASQDNVLILGRGAQFILDDYPFVLKTRIIAPYNVRVDRIQEERGIAAHLAEKIVTRTDHERSGFIHYLYQKDINGSLAYDIIINTSMFDKAAITNILVDKTAAIVRACPLSDEIKTHFRLKSLETKVKAIIQKEIDESIHIDVTAEMESKIILSGYISTEEEKDKTAQCAASISDVQTVTNKIIVFQSI